MKYLLPKFSNFLRLILPIAFLVILSAKHFRKLLEKMRSTRFGAYLETLFGQVNMRVVLAKHPFELKDEG